MPDRLAGMGSRAVMGRSIGGGAGPRLGGRHEGNHLHLRAEAHSPSPFLFRSSRYGRDMPVVVPSRKSLPRTLLIGPGIPMHVVVPSVSLAALLQGTAGTVCVETPSGATRSQPASVAGSNGPPTSGGPPRGGVPTTPDDGDAAEGGAAVFEPGVCAKAADAKRANAAATKIARIGDPPMNDEHKEPRIQKVPA
jgi:hypothetical protein